MAELAGNAVRHGRVPGRRFHVRITDDGHRLQLEVDDAAPAFPAPVDAPEDAEEGRGLRLVAALAGAWGVSSRAHGIGKTVWAIVPHRPAQTPRTGVASSHHLSLG